MKHAWNFEAIGTKWQITIEPGDEAYTKLRTLISTRIEQFDQIYSRFRHDSMVTKWSRPGTYTMPGDGLELFDFYHDLYVMTDGLVTPLIGQLMNDAGYDPNYSFVQKALHIPPAWDKALEYTSHRIITKQPVVLDFGAAGKGYLVDLILKLICEEKTISSVTINAGGDLRHWSRESQDVIMIGLENPFNHSEIIGTTELSNSALCGSSGSRRQWSNLHHIISPVDLVSPEKVIATWVKASNAMTADGIATALFFVRPERLLSKYSFSYAILDSEGELSYSPMFLKEIYTA